MQRRTLMQGILGLFGIGAVAVEAKETTSKEIICEFNTKTLKLVTVNDYGTSYNIVINPEEIFEGCEWKTDEKGRRFKETFAYLPIETPSLYNYRIGFNYKTQDPTSGELLTFWYYGKVKVRLNEGHDYVMSALTIECTEDSLILPRVHASRSQGGTPGALANEKEVVEKFLGTSIDNFMNLPYSELSLLAQNKILENSKKL